MELNTQEQKLNGGIVTVTETDVAEASKPEMIPLAQDERETMQACLNDLQRSQQEAQRLVSISQNQLSAYIYTLAVQKQVDLGQYEFDLTIGGFKRK